MKKIEDMVEVSSEIKMHLNNPLLFTSVVHETEITLQESEEVTD